MIAITREVSEAIARCELTHLERVEIDLERARAEHTAYEEVLRDLGVEVVRAWAEPGMADAVFVEDTAVVVPEVGVITRPGAESRREEVAGVAEMLKQYRELKWITEPGTLDGGDVLRVGKTVYVGRSGRTNREGIVQLAQILGRWGYRVEGVEVTGCLHLKSAVTQVGDRLLLVNPKWVDRRAFSGVDFVGVAEGESFGANSLLVGGKVIYGSQFPRTRERLERRGVNVVAVACGELAKAEGAVTCCSILVD